MNSTLKVLFLAAEAEPFVKVGGLGDVAGSLPPALQATGEVDVRLVIPFYGIIHQLSPQLQKVASFDIPHLTGPIRAQVFSTKLNDLTVYLVSGNPIPPDGPVYSVDPSVDGHKFTFFSLAALKLTRALIWQPDILHANDWHTAPAVYAHKFQNDPFFQNTVSVFGVHNLPYMGVGAGKTMMAYGLPKPRATSLPTWALNIPLPLGLLAADHIITPSPTYAHEILTPDYGLGLEGYLKKRSSQISGILNGIDIQKWNPSTDPLIQVNYSQATVDQRAMNKQSLLAEVGLNPDPQIPLIGLISRLDAQKGIDLIPPALQLMADQPWQAVLLASGDPILESALRKLELDYPSKVRSILRYDAGLSHQIFSAADVLLIPSRYEPCGLTQMIAMRYGCIPIARATGGLQDTILDYDHSESSTGFLFKKPEAIEFAASMQKALRVFQDPDRWTGLQNRAMAQDFSWEKSAFQYIDLYRRLIEGSMREGSAPKLNPSLAE
jgi:starch synthase